MKIYKAELLEFAEILRLHRICDKDDVTEAELKELRGGYLDKAITLLEDYNMYVQEDMYGSQPGDILRTLSEYHLHISAYIGVGESITERLKTTVYRRLTEPDDEEQKKKKLTQVDRDNFSKAEVATLKGVIETLNRVSYNIHERSEMIKDKKKR